MLRVSGHGERTHGNISRIFNEGLQIDWMYDLCSFFLSYLFLFFSLMLAIQCAFHCTLKEILRVFIFIFKFWCHSILEVP